MKKNNHNTNKSTKTIYFLFTIFFLCPILSYSQGLNREEVIKIESLLQEMYYEHDENSLLSNSKKILEIDPDNLNGIAYFGKANYKLSNYDIALEYYNKFLQEAPNSPHVLIERAKTYLNLDQMDNFHADMEKIQSIDYREGGLFYRIALIYKNIGDDEEALKNFETSLKYTLIPTNVYYELSTYQAKQKNYDKAFQLIDSAITILEDDFIVSPESVIRFYYRKAELSALLNKYDDAIEAINHVIIFYPENPDYYIKRANYYLKQEKTDLYCEDIQSAFSLSSVSVNGIDINKCKPKKMDFKMSNELKRQHEAIKNLNLGMNSYLKEYNLNEALDYINHSLKIDSKNKKAKSVQAYLYLLVGEEEKGEKMLNQLHADNEIIETMMLTLADVKRNNGEYQKALKLLEEHLLLHPNSPETISSLGDIYDRMGDSIQAEKYYTQVIDLNPYLSGPYLARSQNLLTQTKYQEALKDITKAVELEQMNPFQEQLSGVYSLYSEILDALGKYELALKQIDKAISIKQIGYYYYFSGEIKARMDNLDDACEDWKISLKLGYEEAESVLHYNCK